MACATDRTGRRTPAARDAGEPARIAANIVAADLACLGHEVAAAVRSGADRVHVDVMEFGAGAASAGPRICRALRKVTGAPLEVHLLVKPSEALVAAFAEAGADLVVFHPEACDDVRGTGAAVRRHGCAVGLALAAGAPLDGLGALLDGVDVVLVTGASPRAGAPFAPATLRWLRALRERISARHPEVAVSVEGGVDAGNGGALADAGADELVVESPRCRAGGDATNIVALRRTLRHRAAARAGAAVLGRGGDLPS